MPGIIKLIVLFLCIQSIDNFILQPTIFSRAFQAHPLEIFIVAVSAGLIGGVMWMVIAMPLYTMIRIIFSELIINIK
jgi:predicted PurR-regulated permease PerM